MRWAYLELSNLNLHFIIARNVHILSGQIFKKKTIQASSRITDLLNILKSKILLLGYSAFIRAYSITGISERFERNFFEGFKSFFCCFVHDYNLYYAIITW